MVHAAAAATPDAASYQCRTYVFAQVNLSSADR
jgi:hypothetical protein